RSSPIITLRGRTSRGSAPPDPRCRHDRANAIYRGESYTGEIRLQRGYCCCWDGRKDGAAALGMSLATSDTSLVCEATRNMTILHHGPFVKPKKSRKWRAWGVADAPEMIFPCQ